VCFCDLRGFTAFAETAEPEDLIRVVSEFHAAMGEVIFRFEGTLEHFEGDGMMVFFNDPLPCEEPELQAVLMALAMRDRARDYATLGRIGFEGRFDYGAIGNVTNLAARLCSVAEAGQILVPQRVASAVEARAALEPIGEMTLHGLQRPVAAFNVTRLRSS
jgi:class 3 adenylate cyclase